MLWTVDHLLVVTLIAFLAAVFLVAGIFLGLTRHYHHEGTGAAVGSAVVSVLVSVIFTVAVNNLYSMKRDRDSRLRNLRDQHYTQLKPILKSESINLMHISEQMAKLAHLTQIGKWDSTNENPAALLWPDVLSHDLKNHFSDYDRSKAALLSEIDAQEHDFTEAVETAKSEIEPSVTLDPYWREIDGHAFVLSCLGRGNGVKVRITGSGYSFETPTSSVSSSGGGTNPPRPSPDQIAAASVYDSMKLTRELSASCESLKHRADAIQKTSKELSKQAELLGESTILPGNCPFITSDNLSY